MASSSIVIKVKFGETLRRFNALVHDEKLDFDIVWLREKIHSLFSFAPDADFTLTYIDEDGDIVTLADEDDLCDVVRQSLDPLRITVKLNADKLGRSSEKSSGSSTPLRSPQDQLPLQTLNSGISEVLKSVPEPLQNAIPKLFDLASKATSSTPVLGEVVEKMKIIYLNQLSESHGPKLSTHSATSENAVHAFTAQQGLKIDGASEKLSGSSPEASPAKPNFSVPAEFGSTNSKSKAVQLQQVNEYVKLGPTQLPRPVDLNIPYSDPENFQYPDNKDVKKSASRNSANITSFSEHNTQVASDTPVEKSRNTIVGVQKKVTGAEKKKDTSSETPDGVQQKSADFGTFNPDYLKRCLQDSKTTEMGDCPWLRTTKANKNFGSSSVWEQGMLTAINECPFTGIPLSSDSTMNAFPFASHVPPFKRSYSHGNGMGGIFHRGIRCDGCGVHPITGPRFKSKVKHNYDLCSICFDGMGRDSDYIRMDHPVTSRHPLPPKGVYDSSGRMLPHVLRAPGMKPSRPKLDGRFILDVNVLDGTLMAPSTTFTKIWRMRNNGNIFWPQGSQLLWIGGDKLSNIVSVEVEIPVDGLPVNKELDIAVDFTAPELPGRYVSYWRMASPSGQKFGQRVWVLIQVDASMKDLGETSINLNLHPVSNETKDPERVNAEVNQDPLMDSILSENSIIRIMELENPFSDSQPNKNQETNFPINDTLIINNNGVSSTTAAGTASPAFGTGPYTPSGSTGSSISMGAGGSPSPVEPVVYPALDFPRVQPNVEQPSGSNDQEQTLLRELEEMGFKQVDLNKEILRMNEYNLEQSVDDLCVVSGWDPILYELRTMGFSDEETNKKLLKKNNGSIKRVVMDLINGETA